MTENREYMVSVRLMTYNHGKYIAQAIQSILDQKVDFNVEVVIGDDFSADNTLEVARSFESTDRVTIKILEREKGDAYWQKRQELGRLYNFTNIMENCTGKYIALLDGDDYWVDPNKLQTQVDFMEANPDYTVSMGLVNKEFESSGRIKRKSEWVNPEKDGTYTLSDYIKRAFSQTPTFLFRNTHTSFPDWFYDVHAGDQSCVVLYTAQGGKIKVHNSVFAVYRVNANSVSHTVSFNKHSKFLETIDIWDKFLDGKYKEELNYNRRRYKLKEGLSNCKNKFCKGIYYIRLRFLEGWN